MLKKRKELQSKIQTGGNFKISTKLAELIIVLVSLFSLVFIISPGIIPKRVHLELGQPSTADIVASRTIIDRQSTEALQKQAVEGVPTIWEVSTTVKQKTEKDLESFLLVLKEAFNRESSADRVSYLKENLPQSFSYLGEQNLSVILASGLETLQTELTTLKNILNEIYDRGVKEADLELAKIQGIARLAELMPGSSNLLYWQEFLETSLQVNVKANLEATEKERENARNKVEAVTILKNQNIIRTGQIVTEHHLALLQDLGMLDSKLDWSAITSGIALVLLLFTLQGIYMYHHFKYLLEQPRLLAAIALIVIVTLLLGRGLMTVAPPVMVPVAAAALILAVLFDEHLALVTGLFLSILAGVLTNFELQAFLTYFVSTAAAVLGADLIQQRTELMKKGIWVSLSAMLTMAIVTVMNSGFSLVLLSQSLWGALLGVMTGILALGTLPFLEAGFGILTPLKLLELANPNHPLMKRLLMEAPGTYQHSMMVSNLAEGAAEAIGADPLLIRAGGFFHDVGKMKRPLYFTENQTQWDNPHEGLPPKLSAGIIISHVKEGLELAREYSLPPEITEFIATHHGTMRAGHFYNLAKEQNPDEELNPDDFSYPGPLPRSKEASILMLADSCEAAVRSMPEPNAEKISQLVARMVQARASAGQFDESALSMREISQVQENLVKRLTSMYHKRVQYRVTPEQMAEGIKTKEQKALETLEESAKASSIENVKEVEK